ncbi:mucin-3A-like [Photinus pyralis]|uniref:mucin-3A-like n=1 Tax=Photinus pyralis TaxID=7054 RepID=UPI0012674677|nr:mucin-3A-like [Photinus pyralis]
MSTISTVRHPTNEHKSTTLPSVDKFTHHASSTGHRNIMKLTIRENVTEKVSAKTNAQNKQILEFSNAPMTLPFHETSTSTHHVTKHTTKSLESVTEETPVVITFILTPEEVFETEPSYKPQNFVSLTPFEISSEKMRSEDENLEIWTSESPTLTTQSIQTDQFGPLKDIDLDNIMLNDTETIEPFTSSHVSTFSTNATYRVTNEETIPWEAPMYTNAVSVATPATVQSSENHPDRFRHRNETDINKIYLLKTNRTHLLERFTTGQINTEVSAEERITIRPPPKSSSGFDLTFSWVTENVPITEVSSKYESRTLSTIESSDIVTMVPPIITQLQLETEPPKSTSEWPAQIKTFEVSLTHGTTTSGLTDVTPTYAEEEFTHDPHSDSSDIFKIDDTSPEENAHSPFVTVEEISTVEPSNYMDTDEIQESTYEHVPVSHTAKFPQFQTSIEEVTQHLSYEISKEQFATERTVDKSSSGFLTLATYHVPTEEQTTEIKDFTHEPVKSTNEPYVPEINTQSLHESSTEETSTESLIPEREQVHESVSALISTLEESVTPTPFTHVTREPSLTYDDSEISTLSVGEGDSFRAKATFESILSVESSSEGLTHGMKSSSDFVTLKSHDQLPIASTEHEEKHSNKNLLEHQTSTEASLRPTVHNIKPSEVFETVEPTEKSAHERLTLPFLVDQDSEMEKVNGSLAASTQPTLTASHHVSFNGREHHVTIPEEVTLDFDNVQMTAAEETVPVVSTDSSQYTDFEDFRNLEVTHMRDEVKTNASVTLNEVTTSELHGMDQLTGPNEDTTQLSHSAEITPSLNGLDETVVSSEILKTEQESPISTPSFSTNEDLSSQIEEILHGHMTLTPETESTHFNTIPFIWFPATSNTTSASVPQHTSISSTEQLKLQFPSVTEKHELTTLPEPFMPLPVTHHIQTEISVTSEELSPDDTASAQHEETSPSSLEHLKTSTDLKLSKTNGSPYSSKHFEGSPVHQQETEAAPKVSSFTSHTSEVFENFTEIPNSQSDAISRLFTSSTFLQTLIENMTAVANTYNTSNGGVHSTPSFSSSLDKTSTLTAGPLTQLSFATETESTHTELLPIGSVSTLSTHFKKHEKGESIHVPPTMEIAEEDFKHFSNKEDTTICEICEEDSVKPPIPSMSLEQKSKVETSTNPSISLSSISTKMASPIPTPTHFKKQEKGATRPFTTVLEIADEELKHFTSQGNVTICETCEESTVNTQHSTLTNNFLHSSARGKLTTKPMATARSESTNNIITSEVEMISTTVEEASPTHDKVSKPSELGDLLEHHSTISLDTEPFTISNGSGNVSPASETTLGSTPESPINHEASTILTSLIHTEHTEANEEANLSSDITLVPFTMLTDSVSSTAVAFPQVSETSTHAPHSDQEQLARPSTMLNSFSQTDHTETIEETEGGANAPQPHGTLATGVSTSYLDDQAAEHSKPMSMSPFILTSLIQTVHAESILPTKAEEEMEHSGTITLPAESLTIFTENGNESSAGLKFTQETSTSQPLVHPEEHSEHIELSRPSIVLTNFIHTDHSETTEASEPFTYSAATSLTIEPFTVLTESASSTLGTPTLTQIKEASTLQSPGDPEEHSEHIELSRPSTVLTNFIHTDHSETTEASEPFTDSAATSLTIEPFTVLTESASSTLGTPTLTQIKETSTLRSPGDPEEHSEHIELSRPSTVLTNFIHTDHSETTEASEPFTDSAATSLTIEPFTVLTESASSTLGTPTLTQMKEASTLQSPGDPEEHSEHIELSRPSTVLTNFIHTDHSETTEASEPFTDSAATSLTIEPFTVLTESASSTLGTPTLTQIKETSTLRSPGDPEEHSEHIELSRPSTVLTNFIHTDHSETTEASEPFTDSAATSLTIEPFTVLTESASSTLGTPTLTQMKEASTLQSPSDYEEYQSTILTNIVEMDHTEATGNMFPSEETESSVEGSVATIEMLADGLPTRFVLESTTSIEVGNFTSATGNTMEMSGTTPIGTTADTMFRKTENPEYEQVTFSEITLADSTDEHFESTIAIQISLASQSSEGHEVLKEHTVIPDGANEVRTNTEEKENFSDQIETTFPELSTLPTMIEDHPEHVGTFGTIDESEISSNTLESIETKNFPESSQPPAREETSMGDTESIETSLKYFDETQTLTSPSLTHWPQSSTHHETLEGEHLKLEPSSPPLLAQSSTVSYATWESSSGSNVSDDTHTETILPNAHTESSENRDQHSKHDLAVTTQTLTHASLEQIGNLTVEAEIEKQTADSVAAHTQITLPFEITEVNEAETRHVPEFMSTVEFSTDESEASPSSILTTGQRGSHGNAAVTLPGEITEAIENEETETMPSTESSYSSSPPQSSTLLKTAISFSTRNRTELREFDQVTEGEEDSGKVTQEIEKFLTLVEFTKVTEDENMEDQTPMFSPDYAAGNTHVFESDSFDSITLPQTLPTELIHKYETTTSEDVLETEVEDRGELSSSTEINTPMAVSEGFTTLTEQVSYEMVNATRFLDVDSDSEDHEISTFYDETGFSHSTVEYEDLDLETGSETTEIVDETDTTATEPSSAGDVISKSSVAPETEIEEPHGNETSHVINVGEETTTPAANEMYLEGSTSVQNETEVFEGISHISI